MLLKIITPAENPNWPKVWKSVENILIQNSDVWNRLYTIEAICQLIETGRFQLWIGFEEKEEKNYTDNIDFVIVTKIVPYPRANIMHYEIAAGCKLIENLETVVPLIEEIAIRSGINYMVFTGRVGFLKYFLKNGYDADIHQVVKTLKTYPTKEVH